MTPPLGVHPHVVVVVSPLVCPSASEMAVGPITGLLVILVIVVTLLTLVTLITLSASLWNPGTSVSRLMGLKVVSASRIHRVIRRAKGRNTRCRLVLNILFAINWNLWLSILDHNRYSL